MALKRIPEERLIELQEKLCLIGERSLEKKRVIEDFADFYGVSKNTVYRCLRQLKYPRELRRCDRGIPRKIKPGELEMYCQMIAAIKIKSNNKKNHHLSTFEAIRLIENYGIHGPKGFIKAPAGILKRSTVDRYLKLWGYDMDSLFVEETVRRFEAKHSNECWQFDLSQSDLKDIPEWPDHMDPKKGKPILMLYSVVDDRSGVAYQEYHAVYGEDVEAALRFLFKAMSAKNIDGFPFQGIPQMIYTDNGPISRSLVFKRVMNHLGIDLRLHMPKGKGGKRVTARSKGKVERPFRTVKEVHETLYHFHEPKNIEEKNAWLLNYILRYNEREHRRESHSRIDDWIKNLPPSGIRQMCSWERFCAFAREPEKRKVGPDARVTCNGVSYEVNHELADHEVILWLGILDNELYVEKDEQKFGPYKPIGGPIPLHRFRSFKKTQAEKNAEKIESLAKQIYLPKEALTDDPRKPEDRLKKLPDEILFSDFNDPDPFNELTFRNIIEAKRAISNTLGIPLAKLPEKEIGFINDLLKETMDKKKILAEVRNHFKS